MKVIWTIDPENRVITVEPVEGYTVEVGQREVTAEQSPYKFKIGDRVRNLNRDDLIKEDATGTVCQDESAIPFVIWDSPDMLTERGQCEDRRWAQHQEHLELITDQAEVTEAHSSLVLDELQNRVSGEALEMGKPDYSHLIGKWVYSTWHDHYKWVKIIGEYDGLIENLIVQVPNAGKEFLHISWLNLTDPRDTNPDETKEVRIPFSLERYDSGDFIRYETRDGRVPENVFVRKNRGEIGPVVVTLPYQIYVLSIGGYYIASGKEEFSLDLFMVIKEGDK